MSISEILGTNLPPTPVGMYRNEETFEPVFYFEKLAKQIDERLALVIDPMLATGSSLELAYQAFLSHGTPGKLHICCAIAAQAGIDHLCKVFPNDEVTLWVAAVDPELNDEAYIVPGLGDAGDLSFGPKL